MNKVKFENPYPLETQIVLLRCLISSTDLFTICRTIVKDEYFDDQLRPAVRFILQHTDDYRCLPHTDLITAKTGQHLPLYDNAEIERQREWFLNDIEAFCRHRAAENAIFAGHRLIVEQGDVDGAARLMKEAVTIGLVADIGTDYFADPAARLHRMRDKDAMVATGWKVLDDKLYGGFSRGGLNVFCGGSGSGKSLVLQNLARNWVFAGFVVIFFSLELSEDFVSLRLDSMNTQRTTREVLRNIDDVALLLRMKAKKAGRLIIKKIPGGSTTNDLRGYLKTIEIQTGLKPHAIIVDYLDLMYANDRRIDPSDLFIKDKFVSEELRELMDETRTFGATASQLNRAAVDAHKNLNHSHIAGGISKINTSDNVIAIESLSKDRGEYVFHLLKTRSSAGVDQRIKLKYDRDCMLITDPEGDAPRSYDDLKTELKERSTSDLTTNTMSSMMNNAHR